MNGLPPGWAMTHVTDICTLHDGRRVPLNASKRETMKGDYPYYGANGLVDHVNDYLFDGSYVLLAEDGGNFDNPMRGVAYEASGKFWVNNHAHILEPLGGMSARFVRYLLNSMDWMPFVGGSTRLKLTQGGLSQAKLALPPLPEQRRIATKIDNVSAIIGRARTNLDRIPQLVETYKQAILEAAFRGDLTGATQNSIVETRIGEVLSFGPQNGLYLPKETYGRGTPILRIQSFGINEVDDILNWQKVQIPADVQSQYALGKNDLVINRVNSPSHLGKSMIVTEHMVGAVFESNMMRMKLSQKVSPKYLQLYLSSHTGRARLIEDAKWAVNQASINQTDVKNTLVPLTSFSDQERIVRAIETSFDWIDHLAAEATNARKLIDELDQAILAKALRGKLVPQDPDDEPASRLLERIKAERQAAPLKRGSKSRAATSS